MVESKGQSASEEKKPSTSRELFMCLTGVEKHFDEKATIKFLRKCFCQKEEDVLPVKAVAKKRGQSYCFLEFKDTD